MAALCRMQIRGQGDQQVLPRQARVKPGPKSCEREGDEGEEPRLKKLRCKIMLAALKHRILDVQFAWPAVP